MSALVPDNNNYAYDLPSKPQEIVENVATFRRAQEPVEFLHVPEIAQRRKMTDVTFLLAFVLSVIVLLSLMAYALPNSDIQRFMHGYDNCGNVCGQKNNFDSIGTCTAEDMTDKPYLVYQEYKRSRTCASNCNSSLFTQTFHRCFPRNFFTYDDAPDLNILMVMVNHIDKQSSDLIILCFSGFGFSVIAVTLLRYFLNIFIWSMLGCYVGLMFALAGYTWYLYIDSGNNIAYLGLCISLSFFSFFLLIWMWRSRSNIKFIIGFFEEAVRIIFAMPLILLEPVLTFVVNAVVLGIFVYTFLLMTTSGNLEEEYLGYDKVSYAYIPNAATTFALWFSAFMLLWMLQFTFTCQHMVISGAVSAQYFARDKLALVSPIYNSFYNLIRYHLGTAAFGPLIITFATIIKKLMKIGIRDNTCLCCLYTCCKRVEHLLKYLASMAYIQTAIHGQPFLRSSIRAVNLITSNLLNDLTKSIMGDLVFLLPKLVVAGLNLGVGVLLNKGSPTTLYFGALVALLWIHCFFMMFETALDTIFLCYCEDQCINDGNINPYVTNINLYNKIKDQQELVSIETEKQKQNKCRCALIC